MNYKEVLKEQIIILRELQKTAGSFDTSTGSRLPTEYIQKKIEASKEIRKTIEYLERNNGDNGEVVEQFKLCLSEALTKDKGSMMITEINGTPYTINIDKFIPAEERIKQLADIAGIPLTE